MTALLPLPSTSLTIEFDPGWPTIRIGDGPVMAAVEPFGKPQERGARLHLTPDIGRERDAPGLPRFRNTLAVVMERDLANRLDFVTVEAEKL